MTIATDRAAVHAKLRDLEARRDAAYAELGSLYYSVNRNACEGNLYEGEATDLQAEWDTTLALYEGLCVAIQLTLIHEL